jgi:hypothetical protein
MIKSEPKSIEMSAFNSPWLLYNGKQQGKGMLVVIYLNIEITKNLLVIYSEISELSVGMYVAEDYFEWYNYNGALLISNE